MIRFIESKISLVSNDACDMHFTMDRTIWQKCKEYFVEHREQDTIPIFSAQGQLICYAWQDAEANREVRMLRELQEKQDAVNFCDLYPDYSAVLIHGCNELAWNMREYFLQKGIAVNVDGRFWRELGVEEGRAGNLYFSALRSGRRESIRKAEIGSRNG